MIRILGIDPGSRITGYGIIEVRPNQAVCISHGCIKVEQQALSERLMRIHLGLTDLIEQFSPQEMAIESVFVQRNVDSALKLGQARGAAIASVALSSIPVHEYSPAEIKKSVVGRGNAAKQQVQHMVKAILGLHRSPQADAADALAVALCHGHSRDLKLQHPQLRQSRRNRRWRSL
jgi:crossover junction endodeoxyribonuclease RuvC